MSRTRRGRPVSRRRTLLVAVALPAVVLLAGGLPAGATGVTVTVTPSGRHPASAHTYYAGQTVTIAVGPNKVFAPYSRINVLMCADPGGRASRLPKDVSGCDGSTIQGDSILVNKNGSFSEHNYTVYQLPSPVLGESATWKPVCNRTHPCVLYVGQNQEDFTAPKVFSAPFIVVARPKGTR